MKRIGWFTTARGPGSFNLFSTIMSKAQSGEVKARLSFIFINREVKGNPYRTKLIKMAEESGIPVILHPSDTFMPDLKERDIVAWRSAYGEGLRERISEHEMDFGVLAGYMQIVDPETCQKYTIINLHPALPETYTGTWEEIVGRVVANHDNRYGATVHLCTPELDRGETIAYDSFPLAELKARYARKEDLVQHIRAEEVRREAHLLISTIRMIVDGEVTLKDGKVFDRQGKKVTEHPCLADNIDLELTKG